MGQTVSTIKPWKYLTSQLIVTRGTSWSSEVTFLSDPPALAGNVSMIYGKILSLKSEAFTIISMLML